MRRMRTAAHRAIVACMAVTVLILLLFAPQTIREIVGSSDIMPLLILLAYLPGFFLLLGIVEVLLPERWVVHRLGKESGWQGSATSFLLGAFIPGPIYIAFPIAAVMLRTGVSKFNVALFISAWSFNIIEEIFELQFLGARFMALRFLVSIPFIVIIAAVLHRTPMTITRSSREDPQKDQDS